jgi:hypothetical protein
MEDGAGPRALAAAERAALARRRGPPSTRTLIEIALKQASACPHAGAGGARSRAISDRYWRTSAATPRPRSDVSALCRALFFLSRPPD